MIEPQQVDAALDRHFVRSILETFKRSLEPAGEVLMVPGVPVGHFTFALDADDTLFEVRVSRIGKRR